MNFDRKQQLDWKKHPFDICSNQGKLVGRIRAVGGLREGGVNCLKYLKRGVERKRGEGKQILKRGQAASRVGTLKRAAITTSIEVVIVSLLLVLVSQHINLFFISVGHSQHFNLFLLLTLSSSWNVGEYK